MQDSQVPKFCIGREGPFKWIMNMANQIRSARNRITALSILPEVILRLCRPLYFNIFNWRFSGQIHVTPWLCTTLKNMESHSHSRGRAKFIYKIVETSIHFRIRLWVEYARGEFDIANGCSSKCCCGATRK